jgi:Cu(I)/Ag(I) efflux system membrane fusion protein
VYVKTEKDAPVFEAREITLGNRQGTAYEVLSGLNAEEEIVINGAFTVDAAAQLQGKKSMMHQNQKQAGTTTTEKLSLNEAVEKAFQPSILAYAALKDALVQSDSLLAVSKSEDFRKALEKLNISQRKQLQNAWALLHKTSKGINANVTLKKQRQNFEIISNTMIGVLQQFNHLHQNLYVQFCPMANNDKGAYWLSLEQHIKNPYFGDMMLTCGNVSKVLERTKEQL